MILFIKILFKEIYRTFTDKDFRHFLKLILKYSNSPRYSKKKLRYSNYSFIVPDVLSFIWQCKEIFVDKDFFFSTKSTNPVIYDCGANIGTSVIYFKNLYSNSKIKVFEANPEIAEILLQNIKKNNITEVEIIKKAVWIDNNGVDFNLNSADSSSIFTPGKKTRVESVRLKDLIDKEGSIDLLKMDIEGAEVDVIKDCDNSIKKIDNIIIEYHSFVNRKQQLDELLKILSNNGFRYFLKSEADRKTPLINKLNINNPEMDLQLNIFAYRK